MQLDKYAVIEQLSKWLAAKSGQFLSAGVVDYRQEGVEGTCHMVLEMQTSVWTPVHLGTC